MTANFDGVRAARAAATWQELQEVQAWHDREYHPDVVGLARLDQVRHCALHVAKLCGWYARGATSEVAAKEIVDRRLADTLLFGLKLASLANVQLPHVRLPRQAHVGDAGIFAQRLSRSSGL